LSVGAKRLLSLRDMLRDITTLRVDDCWAPLRGTQHHDQRSMIVEPPSGVRHHGPSGRWLSRSDITTKGRWS
jgi:hypothetical protein